MHKSILRLTIPNILSNLTIPMLGIVDTALMGRMPDGEYLAALGVGVAIFNLIYWGFGFLRMGTTGFVAQAFGLDNKTEIRAIFYRGIIVAGSIGLILLVVQLFIWKGGIWIIAPSATVADTAGVYYQIRIWAAPVNLIIMVITGWLLGMQNAFLPMVFALFTNLVNIILSVSFIYFLHMDIDGVAWGTVIAQYAGLLFAGVLLYRKYGDYIKKPVWKIIAIRHKLLEFFRVNLDIFIRTLCLIFAFTFFTAQSARAGDDILAMNTVFLQILAVISYGIDGFAFSAESLVGKYTGLRNMHLLKKAIRLLFGWIIGFGLVFSLILFVSQKPVMHFFTNHEVIISQASGFWFWLILAPLVNGFAYLWDGIYIGATQGKPMRNSMFLATFVVYIPMYYLANLTGNPHALWFSFTFFFIARGGMLWLLSKKYIFGFG
jgi:MATE family, multidrug efflux pump